MIGTYRKEGASARVTTLRGGTRATTARESGVAGYSGGKFFSASVEAREEIGGALLADARALHAEAQAAAARVGIERLRVVRGAASHRFEPHEDDPRSWSEMHAILHLTLLARSGARISILRGGASAGDIDAREIESIARALENARPHRPPRPREPIALSPAVSAAIAAEVPRALPSRILVIQTTHPDYEKDGEGNAIARFDPAGRTPADWPNVFRPSYRSPASRALMHVELESGKGEAAIATEIEVMELVRPPHLGERGLVLDALCSRGDETFFASIELAPERLGAGAANGPRLWFPFGAGAWGRRMTIEGALFR